MTAYQEKFVVNSFIRIAPLDELVRFRQDWNLHHPLSEAQLKYASTIARVVNVSFYHGGYVLYELDAVPGIWHEQCLWEL